MACSVSQAAQSSGALAAPSNAQSRPQTAYSSAGRSAVRFWLDTPCARVRGCLTRRPVLRRFMTTWLLFLPFGLWPILGWAVPGVSCMVAYLLVGTENIGIQLEEPFAIIFMGVIANSCRDSIAEIVESAAGGAGLPLPLVQARMIGCP